MNKLIATAAAVAVGSALLTAGTLSNESVQAWLNQPGTADFMMKYCDHLNSLDDADLSCSLDVPGKRLTIHMPAADDASNPFLITMAGAMEATICQNFTEAVYEGSKENFTLESDWRLLAKEGKDGMVIWNCDLDEALPG